MLLNGKFCCFSISSILFLAYFAKVSSIKIIFVGGAIVLTKCLWKILWLSLLLAYLYEWWSVTDRFYFALSFYDCLVLFVVGIMLFFYVLAIIYSSVYFLSYDIYQLNLEQPLTTQPKDQFNGFWILMVEKTDDEGFKDGIPVAPLSKTPHVIGFVGTIEKGTQVGNTVVEEGRNFACIDYIKALNNSFSSASREKNMTTRVVGYVGNYTLGSMGGLNKSPLACIGLLPSHLLYAYSEENAGNDSKPGDM